VGGSIEVVLPLRLADTGMLGRLAGNGLIQ